MVQKTQNNQWTVKNCLTGKDGPQQVKRQKHFLMSDNNLRKGKKKRKTTWWVTSIYIHTSVQGSLYNLTALPAAANPSLHAPAFNTVDFAKVTLSSFMFTATVSLDSVCSSSCVYYGVGLVLLAESLAAQIWGFPQRGEPFLCKHLQW